MEESESARTRDTEHWTLDQHHRVPGRRFLLSPMQSRRRSLRRFSAASMILTLCYDIGELDLNISGCMNSCGHHHIGHIGILGVDKQGAEYYQISIGGAQGNDAALGKVLGPSVSQAEVPDVIERLIEFYLGQREQDEERFIDVVRRVGIAPFKEYVYGSHQGPASRQRQLAAA